MTLRNPYVWDIPGKTSYFVEMKKEFGTKNPDEVSAKLRAAGHDALVVRNVPVMRMDFSGTSAEIILLKDE